MAFCNGKLLAGCKVKCRTRSIVVTEDYACGARMVNHEFPRSPRLLTSSSSLFSELVTRCMRFFTDSKQSCSLHLG